MASLNLFAVRQNTPRVARGAASAIVFVLLLAAWLAASSTGFIDPMFLPSPANVLSTAWRLYAHEQFADDLFASLYRVIVGFGIAALLAVPLGVAMGAWEMARAAFEPLLGFIRYMPATAFVPLLVLWLGVDDAQKFAVVWLGTFFHLALLVMNSTLSVRAELIDTAQLLGASRLQLVTRVIWPAARPLIWSDLRVVLGWAWSYIVVAELVSANSGVGFQILRASRFLDVSTIFVGIFSIGVVGITSDLAMAAIGRWLFPYRRVHREQGSSS